MRVIGRVWVSICLAVPGSAGIAAAGVPGDSSTATVVVIESSGTWNCHDADALRARWLAEQAWKEGAFQRAGECYLAAGEQALADQAFVKAAVRSTPDTSRRLAANLDEVKAQARQMKDALRRR
jgi:hypothetical protein